jgi:hypothetical protein
MVNFINGNTLTEEGQQTVAFIEAQIGASMQLYESDGDFGHVEGMAGNYKHFYMHVMLNRPQGQAIQTVEEWAQSYPHAMHGAYADMQQAQQQQASAEQIEEATEATKTLAEKFDLLHEELQQAMETITAQQEQIDTLQETKTDKRRAKGKTQVTEEAAPPAEPAAEGDADTEDNED